MIFLVSYDEFDKRVQEIYDAFSEGGGLKVDPIGRLHAVKQVIGHIIVDNQVLGYNTAKEEVEK